MFQNKTTIGAAIDTRPDNEKVKDYKFNELVASTDQVQWQSKAEKDWRTFPIFDQKQTDQCVAFSVAKLMGIQHFIDEGEFIDFSKSHLYERRSNKPSAGMAAQDAFEIVRKEGLTLEPLYPTKLVNNNTAQLDIKKHFAQVGEIFKINNYITVPTNNIDTVASIIQRTKKGVMTWFWGTYNEWDREVPRISDTNISLWKAPVRHSVTAVDAFIHNGEKSLLIEDSWGNRGIKGRRIITEEFFQSRNYYNGYLMNFQFNPSPVRTKFAVSKPVKFGLTNADVTAIQMALQQEGYFPSNVQATGYYGSITAKAVLEWQITNRVDDPMILNQLQGRVFGPKSVAVFNKMFS